MRLSTLPAYVRGWAFSLLIRARGGTVGRGLLVDRRFTSRRLPHPGWQLGDNVYLGIGAIVDAPVGSTLRIGSGAMIMQYSVIAVSQSVEIGPDTQIAEFASVRDHDHGTGIGVAMRLQPLVAEPIIIGRDVWIAARVAVLRGTSIDDGAVIGANSVVKGNIPKYAIAVGSPAIIKRFRAGPEGLEDFRRSSAPLP